MLFIHVCDTSVLVINDVVSSDGLEISTPNRKDSIITENTAPASVFTIQYDHVPDWISINKGQGNDGICIESIYFGDTLYSQGFWIDNECSYY